MLEDLEPPIKQWSCLVRSIKETLDESDAAILEHAVMNPEWKYQSLETALYRKGIKLGHKTIQRHRLKECSCWRT